MLVYDVLINEIKKYLPNNFELKYNNTADVDWKEILPDTYNESVFGVLRVSNGANEYIGTQTVKKLDMVITLCIPNEPKKIFTEAIEGVENFMSTFNDSNIPVATRDEEVAGQEEPQQIVTTAKVLINGRTDAMVERINGLDWVTTDVYLQASIYEDLITSEDIVVTIDNNPLDVGIVNHTYDYTTSAESKILGETQAPTNFGTGNQKQLILVVIPQNKPVYKSLLENEDNANKEYTISYYNGILTRTFSAKLVGVNENCPTGGTYVATIKFLRTK